MPDELVTKLDSLQVRHPSEGTDVGLIDGLTEDRAGSGGRSPTMGGSVVSVGLLPVPIKGKRGRRITAIHL